MNRNMPMNIRHLSHPAPDIAALFLVHELWAFISKRSRRNGVNPTYLETVITVQNGGWRDYAVSAGLSKDDIRLEIEFTLIRHEPSRGSQRSHYWGLDESGLTLNLRIGSKRANLIFRTPESGTLCPDTESAKAAADAQRLWNTATT